MMRNTVSVRETTWMREMARRERRPQRRVVYHVSIVPDYTMYENHVMADMLEETEKF